MRTVIAEDTVLLREGLVRLLTEHGVEVTGTCDTADALRALIDRDQPDEAIVDIRLPRRTADSLSRLTPREREVLALMAEGRSNQGIADEFVITLRAVEKYVSSIFTKLDLPSTGSDSKRVLAALLYLRG
jgi:DNA-binding NarL/FixJ family response regulator